MATAATMLAHVLVRPGEIELRQVARPEPAAGELVIRVRSALTCGTDVKAFTRGHPKFPMPTLFGHEFAGEIAAVGSGVGDWREGDAVMATPTAPCGRCFYCGRQQENLCDSLMETMVLGAYSEYVKLPERIVRQNLFAKPAELPYPVAALLEPLACVMHGLEGIAVQPGDTVVLIGAGAISVLHLLALQALGVERVVVVGRNTRRAETARRLGAAEVITGDLGEARSRVLGATEGRGADLVIECTGQVEVWQAAPGFARRGGQVIFFGGCRPGTAVSIDTERFHYEQLRLSSPFHFTPRAVRRSYEMITGGRFRGEDLISGSFPLDELPQALARHRAGDGIKFAVVPA
ncbi:MAG TPA: alcohol dehydrogenase catalytic domain-containing protein [Terriglobales bacterium]|nr:alcohol dehydrogenase catalytic domain-containing protein [Terriglobales bacterium]